MSVNEETYHIINDYLSGELKGRALDKFKAELKENSELQEAVATQRSIIEAIEAARDKELKAFISKEINKRKTIALNPKWRIALASAAAIALLAVAVYSIAPLLQKDQNNTAQEREQKIRTEAKDKRSEDTASDETTQLETTQVDTQTLAIVTPPVVEELEKELEAEPEVIEDYKTDIDEIDMAIEEVEDSDDADGVDNVIGNKKYTDNAKPATVKKTDATTGAPIATKDADIVVRSDELLGQKSFPVYVAALNLNDRAVRLEEINVESTAKESRSDKKAQEMEEEAKGKSSPTITRAIKVEYWKSVVNYKGYQYNGSQLKLYGVDQQKALEFKELDSRLYVRLDGKQYFIERNQKYNRLVEVTNPTLLKVLNE